MDELLAPGAAPEKEIEAASAKLNLSERHKELTALQTASQLPAFWDNPAAAQETMKQISKLERRVEPWQQLQAGCQELLALIELNDISMHDELLQQFDNLE